MTTASAPPAGTERAGRHGFEWRATSVPPRSGAANPVINAIGDDGADPNAALRWRRLAWFALLTTIYLTAGLWLAYHQGVVFGDALSRVAGARFVLFSRDPHLAAMGFVFTPLTTMLQLPFVWLLNPWPGLLSHAVPAIIVSALAMSGTVLQIAGMLRDRRMSTPWTVLISALFGLHPMIIVYGGNGMSEALFLLTMAVATRFLLRWVGSDDVHDLAAVGIALAMGFLIRYDALAVALSCGVLVGLVCFWRTRQRGGRAVSAAAMDVAILAAPITAAFALWSGVSWLLTGEAVAQFTSQYGNSTILELSGGAADSALVRAAFVLVEWLVLEPGLLLVLAVAVVVTAVRRVPDAAPAITVYGSVLAFQGFVYVSGGTFGFLRFAITTVPLAVSLIGILRPRRGVLYSRRAGPSAHLGGSERTLSRRRRVWSWIAAAALLPGIAVAPAFYADPRFAPQEYAILAGAGIGTDDPRLRLAAARTGRIFQTERDVAGYLDRMRLPDGSVLTDTLYGDAVVVSSARPRQFVIPSDYDFATALNEPERFGIGYLLTVPDTGRGQSDALNLRYPDLYRTGAGIATLEMEFPSSGPDQPSYRLYRLR